MFEKFCNKTVLLRDRKRRTARYVASTRSSVREGGSPLLAGRGTPILAEERGYPVLGYTPEPGLVTGPETRVGPVTWLGYPPPPTMCNPPPPRTGPRTGLWTGPVRGPWGNNLRWKSVNSFLYFQVTMNVCKMLEPHLPDRAIELYKRAADVYNVSLHSVLQ